MSVAVLSGSSTTATTYSGVASRHSRNHDTDRSMTSMCGTSVRVDDSIASDLRRGVRRLSERKVGHALRVLLEPVHVSVDLPARREHDRQVAAARILEHVERHDRVLERAVRLPDELMHLRV